MHLRRNIPEHEQHIMVSHSWTTMHNNKRAMLAVLDVPNDLVPCLICVSADLEVGCTSRVDRHRLYSKDKGVGNNEVRKQQVASLGGSMFCASDSLSDPRSVI